MHIFLMILLYLLIAVVTLIAYSFLKLYVLRKFKPNKWIIFAVAITVLLIPIIVSLIAGKSYFVLQIVTTVFGVVLLLWFIDLIRFKPKKKEKEIVIKSKPKPNRAKRLKEQQNEKK